MQEDIAQRTPVITANPDVQALNHDWALVTEAARRDALTDPAVQTALIGFAAQPVGQTMPAEMLTALNDDQRVSRLARRAGNRLLSYLQLPEVPESAIRPDIQQAVRARPLRNAAADLDFYRERYDETRAQDRVRHLASRGRYTEAITATEGTLVARRYAYARDVKLLALGAELTQHGPLQLSESGDTTLPSGIHLQVSPELGEQGTALLDPAKWRSRTQLKDRVYEITVDDKKYILKERKTDRHTDTKEHGHIDGLTSAEEYETGRQLHDHASKTEGRAKLTWEEPLGYVEYPDGFQFAVFGFEEGIKPDRPVERLERNILNNREQFEAEYRQVVAAAQQYRHHPVIGRIYGEQESEAQATELSFEDFAYVKAQRLFGQARDLYNETLLDDGFVSNDPQPASQYRLTADGLGAEIVGFDYEYLERIGPERIAEIKQNMAENLADAPEGIMLTAEYDTRMERAVHLALLDAEGRLPDSIKYLTELPAPRF